MRQEFDLEFIQGLLDEACEYGLLTEVIVYALSLMKENPNLSETEALIHGYNEWVK